MALYTTTPERHAAAIDAALAHAPANQRKHTPAVLEARERLTEAKSSPEPYRDFELAQILATTPADEFSDKVEELRVEQQRRTIIQDARKGTLGDMLAAHLRDSLIRAADEYLSRVSSAATKAASDLTTAAAELPTSDPINYQAAVEQGHVTALTTALEALKTLRTLSGIHNPRNVSDSFPGVHVSLYVAPPAELTYEELPKLGDKPKSANKMTWDARDLAKAFYADQDRALVDVAAGRYPGFTVAIALTTAEHEARRTRWINAHKTIRRAQYTPTAA